MLRSDVDVLHGRSSFLRNIGTKFYSGWTSFYSHQQWINVTFPLHPLEHISLLVFLELGPSDWVEMKSHSSFNLHLFFWWLGMLNTKKGFLLSVAVHAFNPGWWEASRHWTPAPLGRHGKASKYDVRWKDGREIKAEWFVHNEERHNWRHVVSVVRKSLIWEACTALRGHGGCLGPCCHRGPCLHSWSYCS